MPRAGAPRVANDKALRAVVIAGRKHRVTPDNLLAGRGHRNDARLRDCLALEAFIHGEAEYEGVARSEAAFEQGRVLYQPAVADRAVPERFVVGRRRRIVNLAIS